MVSMFHLKVGFSTTLLTEQVINGQAGKNGSEKLFGTEQKEEHIYMIAKGVNLKSLRSKYI